MYLVCVAKLLYNNNTQYLGMESTMQGIVGAAFEGAGIAIGSFTGGAVYKAKVLF